MSTHSAPVSRHVRTGAKAPRRAPVAALDPIGQRAPSDATKSAGRAADAAEDRGPQLQTAPRRKLPARPSPAVQRLLDEFRLGDVVSHLLRRAHFVAEELFAQEFADESLTPRQKAALVTVHQNPGLNQNALADRLFMDRNTVAEMVKRLAAAALIERTPATADQRAYQLFLAPAGAALLNRVMPRDAAVERRVLERLPEEYRPLFVKCLKMLVEPEPAAADSRQRPTRR